jgi:hypothetical protein
MPAVPRLFGDLFHRAAQGGGRLESNGFFSRHGLAELSLKRWMDIQARARRHLRDCLDIFRYRRDWDVRELSAASSLFLEELRPGDVPASSAERPLVAARWAVLLSVQILTDRDDR